MTTVEARDCSTGKCSTREIWILQFTWRTVCHVGADGPVLIRLHGKGTLRRGRDPGFVRVVYRSDQRLAGNLRVVLPPGPATPFGLQRLHETMEDKGLDAPTAALELSAVAPSRTSYGLSKLM